MRMGQLTQVLRPMTAIRRYYLKVCVLCYLIWIILFELVGQYAAHLDTVDLSLGIDRQIPLIPEFVWPYHLCYIIPLLLVFATKDPHRINRGIFSFSLASLLAFIVYLALPISFARPELGNSLSDRFLAAAYYIDFQPGANKLPSLHVTMAWIVFLACWRQRLSRVGDALVFVLALVISVSTLFVKQHIILDVFAGMILGFFVWWISGIFYDRITDRSLPAPDALRLAMRRARPGIVFYSIILLAIVGLFEAKVL